jgi:hypothetical protein
MSKERAAEVCEQYASAHRDRLRPAPIVLPQMIEHEGGFLVIVAVEASVGQAIGVRFRSKDEVDPSETKAPPEIYGFPVRVGDNTTWLQPEQLSMLMLPELRRTILLLRKIGDEIVNLDTIRTDQTYPSAVNYKILEIEPELNSVSLSEGIVISIDQIRSVFRKGDRWRIAFRPGY